MGYEHDLFISYSHEDAEWVGRVVAALRERGLDVWWDEDILAAQVFTREIEDAIASSHAVAVVVSRASVASEWVRQEYHLALTRDITSDRERPVIPLKLDDAPMPGFLSLRRWISFEVPAEFDTRVGQLFDAVRARQVQLADIGADGAVPPLHEIVASARRRLLVSGHTLSKFVSDRRVPTELTGLLLAGRELTFILLNPHSAYAKAHEPFHALESEGSAHGQIVRTIEFLRGLSDVAGDTQRRGLNVLLTNYMPRFRTILVDDDLCYVSLYVYGGDVGQAPEMTLRRGDPRRGGRWFDAIYNSTAKLLGSADVVHLVSNGKLNESWESGRIQDLLLHCPANECCTRNTNCWEEVCRTVLASQNDNPRLAVNLGLCLPRYEAGTYLIGEIAPDAAFLSHPSTFGTWAQGVVTDDLASIEAVRPQMFARMPKSEVVAKTVAALSFRPPNGNALKDQIWVQEYSDIIRRVIMAVITGDPEYSLNTHLALTTDQRGFMFELLDYLEREKGPSLRDWLQLSVAAGLLGVDQKPMHAATSAIDTAAAIPLTRAGHERKEELGRVADALWQAAKSPCRVDASSTFLQTLRIHERVGASIVSFPDDYLETIVLLRFYEGLLAEYPWVRIECVPRATRCGNDATHDDVLSLLDGFPSLRDSARFRVSPDGPKIGGVNLTKLHRSVMDAVRSATLVDVRGARNYEMMQGIQADSYFGFMVCREISESVTGLFPKDRPFVYIRQKPGTRSFEGFRQRYVRRDGGTMLAARTVADDIARWEGGHLSRYDSWSQEERDRYNALQRFYGTNASRFRDGFHDLIEVEVREALESFLPQERVLVLGCGAGKEVEFLAGRGCDAWGIDFSPEGISLARREHAQLADRFAVDDVYDLEYALDGQFDGIVANAVFLHLLEHDHLEAILGRMHARLTHGGRAFVRLLHKPGTDGEMDDRDPRFEGRRWFVYYSPDDLKMQAERVGFVIQDGSPATHPHAQFPDVWWVQALLERSA